MLVYLILAFCTFDGLFSEAAVHQPYNDPNFQPMENMIAGLRGYNIREGDPLGEKGDPGFVGQLFQATKYDENNRIVALGEYTTTDRGACTNTMQDKKFTTSEQYRKYLEESSSSGVNLQVGNEIDVNVDFDVKGVGVGASTTIPPPFSRSWGRSEQSKSLEQLFTMRHGLLTIATATCIVYDITFGAQIPPFTDHFKKALEILFDATNLPEKQQLETFKTFVEEYGTHYLKKVKMGAQFTQITEYSQELRKNISDSELEECNHKSGAKILGIQVEEDRSGCTKSAENRIENSSKEDMKRSYLTKGSTSLKIDDFIENIVPVPIHYELNPIIDLFTDKIIKAQGITVNGKVVNSTLPLLNWFVPMYKSICIVFGGTNQSCYEPLRGCGYNDKCPQDTICTATEPGDYYCSDWDDWKCIGDDGCEETRSRECFGCDGPLKQTRKNCTAGHRCLYEKLVWVVADGNGGSGERLVGKAKTKRDCARKCHDRKSSHPTTNGATYKPLNKDCYCETGQTSQTVDRDYRNMWFDPTTQIPPRVECEVENGDGSSDDEYFIGTFPNNGFCSLECDKLRRVVREINGMTYKLSDKKCWCERNMGNINRESGYETCRFTLKEEHNDTTKCTYLPADGEGGSEIYIGGMPSAKSCADACRERRGMEPTINGATYSTSGGDCYCERGQTSLRITSEWTNCWFGRKYDDPPSECTYLSGAGLGRSVPHYIGKQSTAQICSTTCYRLKFANPNINGATYSGSSKHCYCVPNMSSRLSNNELSYYKGSTGTRVRNNKYYTALKLYLVQDYRSCQFHEPKEM